MFLPLFLLSFQTAFATTGPAVAPPAKLEEGMSDSAWVRRRWIFEIGYRNAFAWGDLRDGETDMVAAADITVIAKGASDRAAVLLQVHELGVGVWHMAGARLQLGLGYHHSWTLAEMGQSDISLLLSSHSISGRVRYWGLRRKRWQIGPALGVGPTWGTLTRYPVARSTETLVFYSRSAEDVLEMGGEPRFFSGLHLDGGVAMEVRLLPTFTIGGNLQVVRSGMKLTDNDPAGEVLRDMGMPYPADPVQWEAGLELHAAYWF